MVEKPTETTNIDKDTICPSSCPSMPSAGTNKTGTGTALLHHYNVKTESFYFTNNYTQFELYGLKKTEPVSSTPPMNEEWLNETQAGEEVSA